MRAIRRVGVRRLPPTTTVIMAAPQIVAPIKEEAGDRLVASLVYIYI
jgi:hypothetical protein